ncbi:MAG: polysaccharide deacetylase family protein [Christensenellaceae bacterium]
MEKFLYRRMLRALTLLGVLFAVLCYLRVAETGMAVYTAAEAPAVVTSLPQTGKKQVYLTFDTAMGADYVSEILAVLRKYHAKASFGILGTGWKHIRMRRRRSAKAAWPCFATRCIMRAM